MLDKIISFVFWVFVVISILYLASSYQENYVSYSRPWWNDKGYPWNWWRHWWRRGSWEKSIRPRCPQGCIYTGYSSNNPNGYSCGNNGLMYGNWNCQYDFQCSNCNINIDEMGYY